MDNKTTSKISIPVNWQYLSLALFVVVIALLALWRPWVSQTTQRKVSVTGQATIKSTPDEYTLYPYFEYANADRTKANTELVTQSTAISTKLKELGVKDEQIKSNTSGYDKYTYSAPVDNSSNTLTLSYTIALTDKDIAQKVQDYMLSLKAKGQISPQASFSQKKQKELQAQAREQAINDAKQNADVTAKQLNTKVGKVITVQDGLAGGPTPFAVSVANDAKLDSGTMSSLPIQVGQDEYTYSVSVEYELK
ncbi:DUF541 domain-containing protein [bacterium]|nr:DUF541 domain-containing protein [bacterium]NDC94609.1 DUF541 domain-containing protein [bacterium]NDD84494.1 DUF541 domain-containing protein [bacterium]NDG30108.1 DUF541 domain-containing protein [bacterium]